MTEPTPPNPAYPGHASARRRPSILPTAAAALALFVVAFEFLAFELRSGNDPSLASAQAPRPVLTRKVLRTKVVTDVVPTLGKGGTTTSSPATVSSTPAAAPAPVVTSTS